MGTTRATIEQLQFLDPLPESACVQTTHTPRAETVNFFSGPGPSFNLVPCPTPYPPDFVFPWPLPPAVALRQALDKLLTPFSALAQTVADPQS